MFLRRRRNQPRAVSRGAELGVDLSTAGAVRLRGQPLVGDAPRPTPMTAGDGAAARARDRHPGRRRVDGNDVFGVPRPRATCCARCATATARVCLHALTYRIKGHVSVDPAALSRPAEVEAALRERPDPIRAACARGGAAAERALESRASAEVEQAVVAAAHRGRRRRSSSQRAARRAADEHRRRRGASVGTEPGDGSADELRPGARAPRCWPSAMHGRRRDVRRARAKTSGAAACSASTAGLQAGVRRRRA